MNLRFFHKEVLVKNYKFVAVTLKELTISRFAVFSVIALLSLFSWSQHSISGEVKNQAGSGVAYANLLLLSAQDSTVVDGTSSGDLGSFRFNNVLAGDYLIKTSFIGYHTNFKSITVIGEVIVEDIILAESAEELSEVALVFKQPTLKREADRLVFNC